MTQTNMAVLEVACRNAFPRVVETIRRIEGEVDKRRAEVGYPLAPPVTPISVWASAMFFRQSSEASFTYLLCQSEYHRLMRLKARKKGWRDA